MQSDLATNTKHHYFICSTGFSIYWPMNFQMKLFYNISCFYFNDMKENNIVLLIFVDREFEKNVDIEVARVWDKKSEI